MTRVCAYCPTFDPRNPDNRGATHVICPTCQRRIDESIARVRATRETKGQK